MKVSDDLDKMNRVLSIYSIVVNGNLDAKHLRPKCVQILSYYMLFGYDDDVKRMLRNTGISVGNLNQINSELTKGGFLIKDEMNFHNRRLSKDLQMLKDYFFDEENKNKIYAIVLDE